MIEALPNPVFFKDTDGRYLGVNSAWESYFGVPRESFIGKTVYDLREGQWNVPDLHALLEDVLPNNHLFNDFMVEHEFGDLGRLFRDQIEAPARLD